MRTSLGMRNTTGRKRPAVAVASKEPVDSVEPLDEDIRKRKGTRAKKGGVTTAFTGTDKLG